TSLVVLGAPAPGPPGTGAVLLVVIVIVVTEAERILRARERALRLGAGTTLGHPLDQLGEALRVVARLEVEPPDGLRETEVGVDARDHDACIDREDLDADERDADVGIDDQPLVEDDVDDLGQPPTPAGVGPGHVAPGLLGDCHLLLPPVSSQVSSVSSAGTGCAGSPLSCVRMYARVARKRVEIVRVAGAASIGHPRLSRSATAICSGARTARGSAAASYRGPRAGWAGGPGSPAA